MIILWFEVYCLKTNYTNKNKYAILSLSLHFKINKNKMDNTKNELIQKIKDSTHVLVTVSSNPSVDQLAACIGISLWLNKLDKHATAVFSGDIPNALEFLQPEATIEKSTDSLRDFIIALDKSKASKLRYKAEDNMVKIFITPYRSSLSSADLEFSQGDFNVDTIIALGVVEQKDLDEAITSHGRILHDAVVTTINTTQNSSLGALNWNDPSSSSLSELCYEVGRLVGEDQIDPQIANALLTGIVASTDRFSSMSTSPNTMSVAAALMKAGANQQLVSNKLEKEATKPLAEKIDQPPIEETSNDVEDQIQEIDQPPPQKAPPSNELSIDHQEDILEDKIVDSLNQDENAIDNNASHLDNIETLINKPLDKVTMPLEQDDINTTSESPDDSLKSETVSGITSNERIINDPPQNGSSLNATDTDYAPNKQENTVVNPLASAPVDSLPLQNREPIVPSSPHPVPDLTTLPTPLSFEEHNLDNLGQSTSQEPSENPTSNSMNTLSAAPAAALDSFPSPLSQEEIDSGNNKAEKPADNSAIDDLEKQAKLVVDSFSSPLPEARQSLNAQNLDLDSSLNEQPTTSETKVKVSSDNEISGHKVIMPPLEVPTSSLEDLVKEAESEEKVADDSPPEVPPPFLPPNPTTFSSS